MMLIYNPILEEKKKIVESTLIGITKETVTHKINWLESSK